MEASSRIGKTIEYPNLDKRAVSLPHNSMVGISSFYGSINSITIHLRYQSPRQLPLPFGCCFRPKGGYFFRAGYARPAAKCSAIIPKTYKPATIPKSNSVKVHTTYKTDYLKSKQVHIFAKMAGTQSVSWSPSSFHGKLILISVPGTEPSLRA